MYRLKEVPLSDKKIELVSEIVAAIELIEYKQDYVRKNHIKHPLTDAFVSILAVLVRHPKGLTIKEISERLNISSSAVVQQLDTPSGLKMIERKDLSGDKRNTIAFISANGKRYIRENRKEHVLAYYNEIYSVLDDEEMRKLNDLLQKVADHIQPKQNNKKK